MNSKKKQAFKEKASFKWWNSCQGKTYYKMFGNFYKKNTFEYFCLLDQSHVVMFWLLLLSSFALDKSVC